MVESHKEMMDMENRIIFGDCIEQLKELPDNSVDLIFTDLPFGTTKARWDSIIDLAAMWEECYRVAKKATPMLFFCQMPFTITLGGSNRENLRYDWVWEKTTATGHLNAKRAPMKAHEDILVFSENIPAVNESDDTLVIDHGRIMVFYEKLYVDGVPNYRPQKTEGHKRKVSSAKHKRNSKKTELYGNHELTGYDSTERYPRSVLRFATDKQKEALHPTQKPVALLEYMIETYSKPGDTVLDFCAGSGSTAIACLNKNRRYIMVENDPINFNIMKERIEDHKSKLFRDE